MVWVAYRQACLEVAVKQTLDDIRGKLSDGAYTNEEHVRLSLVSRLLQELGWDTWNPSEVNAEFSPVPSEDRSRVDLALFSESPRRPDVFMEIKAAGKLTGDLLEVERQMRNYNRDNTATFSIITDGQRWRFYLSQTRGEFAEKLFKELDMLENDLDDLEESFQMFLSKSSICEGRAGKEAESYLNLNQKQRAMGDGLPKARRDVLEDPFPTLIEALVLRAEEAGFSVTEEDAERFVQESGTGTHERGPEESLGTETQSDRAAPEPSYVPKYRRQYKTRGTIGWKMKTYIERHGPVTGKQLKRVCVEEFGCKSETSGSIGAFLNVLKIDGHIRIEGRGDDKRIFPTVSSG